jgi:hypothetical protein
VIESERLDRDLTSEIQKGERLTGLGLGLQSPARNSGEGALVLSSGDALVVYRGEGEVNGVLRDDINSMVTTAQSFMSLVDLEVWPETWARRVMARGSICCEINQKEIVRGGARERGRR